MFIIAWTRAKDTWANDQGLFKKWPSQVHSLPCSYYEPLITCAAIPDLPKFQVVFSSAKILEYLLDQDKAIIKLKAESIFTVGEATAQGARDEGLAQENSLFTSPHGKALSELIIARADPDIPILQFGPKEPAVSLIELLEPNGFRVYHLARYRTIAGAHHAENGLPLHDLVDWRPILQFRRQKIAHLHLICAFASPSAVHGFSPLLANLPDYIELHGVCIGQTTAETWEKVSKKEAYLSPKSRMADLADACEKLADIIDK